MPKFKFLTQFAGVTDTFQKFFKNCSSVFEIALKNLGASLEMHVPCSEACSEALFRSMIRRYSKALLDHDQRKDYFYKYFETATFKLAHLVSWCG